MSRAENRREKKLASKALQNTTEKTQVNISHLFTEAVQYQQSGQLNEAEVVYQEILSINPDVPEVHYGLGIIQNTFDDNVAAEKSYRNAIALRPNYGEAHANLGNALVAMGQLEESIACYQHAIIHKPKGANLHNSFGVALQKLTRHSDAIASFKTSLSLAPEIAEVHSNLGVSFKATNRFDEALQSYERALSIRPDFFGGHSNKGNVFKDLGLLNEACKCYRTALAIQPDYAEAQCNLGSVLMSMGQLDEALSYFKALGALAANNYLHTLLYQPSISNDDLFNACRKIANERKTANTPLPFPILNLDNKNRIRIGYISSDFREHPVGVNILPLIANHDHQKYEIFCYAELTASDSMTSEFQEHADHWRLINALNDEDVAQVMRDDGIQIAVYIGGNFDDNRPGIAAYKAAPIQVAMYGGTTTASDTMDYWLTDEILHPKDTTERFTEKLWHLPSLFTYPVPKDTPPENNLPAIKNGYVTFVSFNKPCKINDEVIDLWAGVLSAVTNSKLILKFRNYFGDAAVADPILKRFATNGIANNRIELVASIDSSNEHLSHYHQGDIALDTFPFSGATTTFQALWMGLPVVSLNGERFISRMGTSISQHAGLNNLLASLPNWLSFARCPRLLA